MGAKKKKDTVASFTGIYSKYYADHAELKQSGLK
jgi:hypothetical protein